MSDSYTITINDNEYKVIGDEEKINNSVSLLNSVISEFSQNEEHNLSSLDKVTFAALNIAEKKISDEKIFNDKIKELISEIKNIIVYLNNQLIE